MVSYIIRNLCIPVHYVTLQYKHIWNKNNSSRQDCWLGYYIGVTMLCYQIYGETSKPAVI